jgi:23S rRNA (guanine745-N1)-methyltransferase
LCDARHGERSRDPVAVSFLDDSTLPPLACSVRGCGAALAREARALVCERRHSFDIARSGYCNLLQPNDRRSLEAGDSKEHVAARTRVYEQGLLVPLIGELVRVARGHVKARSPALEVGCGPGFALNELSSELELAATGLDLSVHAIDAAARRFPALHWVVANADRTLPFVDASLDLVASVTGPKNPAEFRRVLRKGGRAIVAVPAADDLIELRGAVLGSARETERVERVLAKFAADFELVERTTVRSRTRLDPATLRDLLDSTYRAARTREAERASSLGELDVTLSSEVLVLGAR